MPKDFALSPSDLSNLIVKRVPHMIIDIREDWEHEIVSFPHGKHIPLDKLRGYIPQIPLDKKIILVCHLGVRSDTMAAFLRENGISAYSLKGGIEAWAQEIDPSLPRY